MKYFQVFEMPAYFEAYLMPTSRSAAPSVSVPGASPPRGPERSLPETGAVRFVQGSGREPSGQGPLFGFREFAFLVAVERCLELLLHPFVVGEIDLPDEADWRKAVRGRAVSAHDVFSRHPWAGLLNDTRETSGPARLGYFEWMVGTFRKAGFSLELTTSALSVLDSYIYGFGRQALNLSTAEATPEEMAEAFREALPPNEYPYLAEMVEHQFAHGLDEQAEFDFGLEIILDGLERARDEG